MAAHSDRMGSFAHGFTYSGHPVSCAVSLETIAIYKERGVPAYVKEMEPLFQVRVLAHSVDCHLSWREGGRRMGKRRGGGA